jgi:hypothetical protein
MKTALNGYVLGELFSTNGYAAKNALLRDR